MFTPPLVATIESRTREVRGDLLAEVAAALDVDPASAAEH